MTSQYVVGGPEHIYAETREHTPLADRAALGDRPVLAPEDGLPDPGSLLKKLIDTTRG